MTDNSISNLTIISEWITELQPAVDFLILQIKSNPEFEWSRLGNSLELLRIIESRIKGVFNEQNCIIS